MSKKVSKLYEKYIHEIDKAVFLPTRVPTGVYEWDNQNGFGRMIHVGDIVEIRVQRALESRPNDFTNVISRGVVFLRHGEFRIDIDNEYSAALCRPRGSEIIERSLCADIPRLLSMYSYDYHGRIPNLPQSYVGHNIRILGNIAENPELLVR